MKKLVFAGLGVAAIFAADAASAAVVVNSLPTFDTVDWTRGAMNPGNTGMNSAGEAVLDTYPYSGNWFGWGQAYANTPAWTPGDSSDGNHFRMTARFGANGTFGGPKDWSIYFSDGPNYAGLQINPTGCDGNAEACYDNPAASGVELVFANAMGGLVTQFVSLDTSVNHTYEFLLKNGTVSYRIDNRAWSGLAYSGYAYKLLVVGDGSAPTATGSGTMVVNAVSFDNGPVEDVLTGTVPEPATWGMMIAGFGLLGGAARRRRSVSFA